MDSNFKSRFDWDSRKFFNPLPDDVLKKVNLLPEREQQAFRKLQLVNLRLTSFLYADGFYCDYDLRYALQPSLLATIGSALKNVKNTYSDDVDESQEECEINSQLENLILRLHFLADIAALECEHPSLEGYCRLRDCNLPVALSSMLAQLLFDIVLALRNLISLLVLGGNLCRLPVFIMDNILAGECADIHEAQLMPIYIGLEAEKEDHHA